MNAPEKIQRRGASVRRSGSHAEFLRLTEKLVKNPPRPRKGASIVRHLQEARERR